MFIGEYTYNIDHKGRISVPAKFRNQLKKGAVVTRGLDNCLFLYPREEWLKLAKQLSNLPISQKDARAFARLMLAGAMDVELDSQGRIIIPSYLRQYASLKNNSVIAGLYTRLELWNKTKWNKYKQNAEKGSTDIAERLGELGV
jgi:MraZ protein